MLQLSLFDWIGFGRSRDIAVPQGVSLAKPEECEVSLQAIWLSLRRQWFAENPEVNLYRVQWSERPQRRTLASCNIVRQRVIVARELNRPELHCWLEPLLYHEMCHAVLGMSVVKKRGRSAWHGPEFRALERRHPGIVDLNHWIKSGGWQRAVRSDRARRAHRGRSFLR